MMFNKERGMIPSTDIFRFICEDTRLKNYLKLHVRDEFFITIWAFNKHDANDVYPYNILDLKMNDKNRLIKTAKQTIDDRMILYLRDRDYCQSNEVNILHIDYYSIENYLLYSLKDSKNNEIKNEILMIQNLYTEEVIKDQINFCNDEYKFTNEIHQQYQEYVLDVIVCKNTFLKYLKMDKNIYQRVIKLLPRDTRKKIENMDKNDFKYLEDVRSLRESSNLNAPFFDEDSKKILHENTFLENKIEIC